MDRPQRAKAWDAAKAFLDTRAKDGVLSAEDNTTYDKMLADVDSMARQIALTASSHQATTLLYGTLTNRPPRLFVRFSKCALTEWGQKP